MGALGGAALSAAVTAAKADSSQVPPPASWTVDFSVEAVYATRGNLGDAPLLESDPYHIFSPTNRTILSGDNFGFSWEAGAAVRQRTDRQRGKDWLRRAAFPSASP